MSLTATGTAAADGHVAAASSSTSVAPTTVAPGDSTGVPVPAKTQPATVNSEEKCEPTPADSGERKAGAVQACVTTIATPVSPVWRKSRAAAPPAAAAAAAADTGSCTITTRGTWWHSRFGYCVYSLTVLYTLRDTNGREVGTGTLNVSSSAVLPAKGTKWKEKVAVTMTGATGAVTTVNVKFRAACSAGCKATTPAPWLTKGNLIKDQVISGDVAYESTPGAGTAVDFTTSYLMYVTSPGAQITDPNASWSNPEKIRCDDDVRDTAATGTPDPGCVVPSVMPVVRMSDQQHPAGAGAAAAGYLWAQNNLPNGWGRANPLTRAKDDIAGRAARTCGTFQARTDLVPTDSCGDFPFSHTREGGTDGAQCAEILPRHSARGWVIDVLDGGTSSPCVRAHVPLDDNKAAEAQLLEGFASQRVVKGDQFKVEISGSIAEPQAVCRQKTPAGAFASGNGWIKNTTESVLHINIKTSPPGPPGVRASVAQACLGTVTVEGSHAKGDITGWEDAELFRLANSSTAGLARCHLIANILGGTGAVLDGGQINLVPCWQSGMNTGTPSMRTYETLAQKSVKPVKDGGILGPNDAIFYQVTPHYQNSDSTIPQGVTMSAKVERSDGTSQPLFPDIYISNTYKNTGQLNLGN
ncbi:DNA/RNA non-specific endonuclease [Streptomyces avidinii]|uniref:DNA/RNA non-specific endonuclease n=1 Tax=Streptomyces avidinii TaxID=1895 RepID=UPI00386BF870|nr:DNA/RNA non-specific endonuclease [Streptomyces avidinii]